MLLINYKISLKFFRTFVKLFFNKSNKGKYKVAQKNSEFKKKTWLTVMNMVVKQLLNSHSVHLPLSDVGGGLNLQPNFQKGEA